MPRSALIHGRVQWLPPANPCYHALFRHLCCFFAHVRIRELQKCVHGCCSLTQVAKHRDLRPNCACCQPINSEQESEQETQAAHPSSNDHLDSSFKWRCISFLLLRLSFLPASLSFWSLFFAVKYQFQLRWYASEIASRNDLKVNTGFSTGWLGKDI